jgi:hypothetical protein
MRRALVLALLPLALAACGGGGGGSKSSASGPAAVDAVKTAAQKTYAAGSASLALLANVEASGQPVAVSGTGAFDIKGARGSTHLNVKAGPVATTVDEVLVGTAVYLESPLLTSGLPGGKKWLKLDLQKLRVPGLDLQSLLAQNPGDELKRLQTLKSATKVGTDQAGTHYQVQASTGTIGGYDVWVGDDGYIHRVVIAEAKPKVSVTLDLSKFGEKVTAVTPPSAQVYESKSGSIPNLGGVGA